MSAPSGYCDSGCGVALPVSRAVGLPLRNPEPLTQLSRSRFSVPKSYNSVFQVMSAIGSSLRVSRCDEHVAGRTVPIGTAPR